MPRTRFRRISLLWLLASVLAAQLLLSAHESAHALAGDSLECALCLHAPQLKSGLATAGAQALPPAALPPLPAVVVPELTLSFAAAYLARAPPALLA